jgi:hypothetical protein
VADTAATAAAAAAHPHGWGFYVKQQAGERRGQAAGVVVGLQ